MSTCFVALADALQTGVLVAWQMRGLSVLGAFVMTSIRCECNLCRAHRRRSHCSLARETRPGPRLPAPASARTFAHLFPLRVRTLLASLGGALPWGGPLRTYLRGGHLPAHTRPNGRMLTFRGGPTSSLPSPADRAQWGSWPSARARTRTWSQLGAAGTRSGASSTSGWAPCRRPLCRSCPCRRSAD